MFDYADEFFQSLGMTPMTDTFWEKSVIKKREDVDAMVCHASAWDFMHGPGDGNFDFGDQENVEYYNKNHTTNKNHTKRHSRSEAPINQTQLKLLH